MRNDRLVSEFGKTADTWPANADRLSRELQAALRRTWWGFALLFGGTCSLVLACRALTLFS